MNALVKYIDKNGILKNAYYNTSDYGSIKECLKKLEMQRINISRDQILEIYVSD